MDAKKVDIFLAQNADKLPEEYIPRIKQNLLSLPESKTDFILYLQFKDPMLVLILSVFLGQLGIDRFFLGDTLLGVLKLLTCGGCGIWWLIDLFTVMNKTKMWNYEKLRKAL